MFGGVDGLQRWRAAHSGKDSRPKQSVPYFRIPTL